MLFFYENATFYSFNILITAALYISMVYVNRSSQYQYIFTFLFVYGMYQLIENSFLQDIRYIGFALIGILVSHEYKNLQIKRLLSKEFFKSQVQLFPFVLFYLSVFKDYYYARAQDSLVLFVAYLIIALNYIYLSNMTKTLIFRFLAPIFLMTAGLQSYFILFKKVEGNYVDLYLFTVAVLMFFVFYIKKQLYIFHYQLRRVVLSFLCCDGVNLLSFRYRKLENYGMLPFSFSLFGFIALLPITDTLLMRNGKRYPPGFSSVSWGCSWICLFDSSRPRVCFLPLPGRKHGSFSVWRVDFIWPSVLLGKLETNRH